MVLCIHLQEEFMAKQKKPQTLTVEEIDEGSLYEVHSSSGNTYEVHYCGSGDADPEYVALWECTCPAYKYGRGTCKHIGAVVNFIDDKEYGED
jgi:hypothetical protein